MLKFLLIIIRGSEICQRNSVPKMTFISIFKDNFAIGLFTQALLLKKNRQDEIFFVQTYASYIFGNNIQVNF